MHFAVNTGLLDLVELLNSHGGRFEFYFLFIVINVCCFKS